MNLKDDENMLIYAIDITSVSNLAMHGTSQASTDITNEISLGYSVSSVDTL